MAKIVDEEVSRRAIAVSLKASRLTARSLAFVLAAIGRRIAKEHRKRQTPHGRQTVKKLMGHGVSTNSIELSGETKLFDRVARKWNVDYAFYQVAPDKHLLFFKAGQADAITACFSEYSKRLLKRTKSAKAPIREQIKEAAAEAARQPAQKLERTKEAVHEDR